jgi:hypothetical protein
MDDIEMQLPPPPPNSPIDANPVVPTQNTNKVKPYFQMIYAVLLLLISVSLIIFKDDDAELKVIGIALLSNLSGILLGKVKSVKN